MRWRRWQDWCNAVLGALLFVSPFAYGTYKLPIAWNAYIVGLGIIGVAVWALAEPGATPAEWSNIGLGTWVLISPLISPLMFSSESLAAPSEHLRLRMSTVYTIGALMILFAATALPTAQRIAESRWTAPGRHEALIDRGLQDEHSDATGPAPLREEESQAKVSSGTGSSPERVKQSENGKLKRLIG